MLTLVPKSAFSWDFRVLGPGGNEITLIDRQWLRERATFTIEGKNYQARRTSLFGGRFVLEHQGMVVAEAEKPSTLRRTLVVTTRATRYTVQPESAFRRKFSILEGGFVIGQIAPTSALRRRATVELPPTVPLEIQLFIAFLVLALWKRADDAD